MISSSGNIFGIELDIAEVFLSLCLVNRFYWDILA